MNNLDIAIGYAKKHKWKVFPVHYMMSGGKCSCGKSHADNPGNRGKHPIPKEGFKEASDDITQIHKIWKNPAANIGVVVTQDTGIIVVDIDKHGDTDGEKTLQQLFDKHGVAGFPRTITARTGGDGLHYYFKYDSRLMGGQKFPGIDIRGNGYVLAAPSNHASGKKYEWIHAPDTVELAEVPLWFIEEISRPAPKSMAPATATERTMIGQGQGRNEYLTKMAGKMRHSGMEQDEIEAALLTLMQTRCEITPDFTEKEVLTIARSVSRYEKGPERQGEDHIVIQPSMALDEYLTAKYNRESKRQRGAGDLLGYRLTTLRDIAEKCDGIQPGFYIIGAYPNMGKTALLINMFRDLLYSNQELSGIYFSLDDNKNVIINRLLAIETGIPINQVQWEQNTPDDQRQVQHAYHTLKTFAKSGRLALYDLSEVTNIKQIENEIQKESATKKLVVAIDGLYNIDLGEGKKYGGIREDIIELGNRIKGVVDVHQIPIIATGEVRKKPSGGKEDQRPSLHDLMETGKLGYNANMVWILHPDSMDTFKGANDPTVKLYFEKNKLSEYKGALDLRFYKKVCRMELEGHVTANVNQVF